MTSASFSYFILVPCTVNGPEPPPLGNNGYYKELLPFENQNMKQGSLDLNQSSKFFNLNHNDFLNKNHDFFILIDIHFLKVKPNKVMLFLIRKRPCTV